MASTEPDRFVHSAILQAVAIVIIVGAIAWSLFLFEQRPYTVEAVGGLLLYQLSSIHLSMRPKP